MLKQISIILLLIVPGFFLLPKNTYACGAETGMMETTSCLRENDCKTQDESCCDNHHSHNGRQDNDCGGSCNHGLSCHCASSVIAMTGANESAAGYRSSLKELISSNQVLSLSKGFYSTWLPPKIG